MRQLDLREDVIFPGDMVHIRGKWIADLVSFDEEGGIVETSYDDQTRQFKIIRLQPNSHVLVTKADPHDSESGTAWHVLGLVGCQFVFTYIHQGQDDLFDLWRPV